MNEIKQAITSDNTERRENATCCKKVERQKHGPGIGQEKEQEGEMRREKDLIIYNVPERNSTDSSERQSDNMSVVELFFDAIDRQSHKFKQCTG